MTTLAVSHNPHDITLPKLIADVKLQEAAKSPHEIAHEWFASFSTVLANKDDNKLGSLIHEDSWWRDHLALSWDLRTIRSKSEIIQFVGPKLAKVGFHNMSIKADGKFAPHKDVPLPDLEWVEFMFHFDTAVGSGKGMIRLACSSNGIWKAHMIYTALQTLKDCPEQIGSLRPHGGTNTTDKGNWLDRRQRQQEFLDEDPTVLICGAGQAGLNTAARLQALGLSVLLIDKNERVGDNWRHRYRTLVTHDPVQYTHMAYLPFPPNWPLFTPKDKLGDWFANYAEIMELNIWLGSRIKSVEFIEQSQDWTVQIVRPDGNVRTIKPKHVVMATGHAGEPYIPTFPGQDGFKGTVYHGSQHQDASLLPDVAGKKVVVCGTGNSGHDIAQNYYEAGASVTMLQRSGTYVISASKGLFMLHEGMYEEGSPPIEDADIVGQSLPIPVQFVLNVGTTDRIKEVEKEALDGLTKAGFNIDYGHDGSGIFRKYITRGGGYYLDVGCSQLIIDGKIKMEQSPNGISGFTEGGLVLADGRELEADVVVLATGYDNMRTTVRKILGDTIADRCNDVWDLDQEGEVNAMWRPSGHPRLTFMGGSLALCRIYSRFVALQIAADVHGL